MKLCSLCCNKQFLRIYSQKLIYTSFGWENVKFVVRLCIIVDRLIRPK